MSTPERNPAPVDPRLLTMLLLISVIGVLPYLSVLDYWPWSSDSLKWYSKTHYTDPDALDWSLRHRHFVGYRPLAALTLLVNSFFGGMPVLYRLTDLSLFVLCGGALFTMWRCLFRNSQYWGLLLLSIFYLHPSAQEILPFLARRSYLLAVLFGTLSLAAFCRYLDGKEERKWLLATCVTLALALFSNEFAYITLGVCVLLALRDARVVSVAALKPTLGPWLIGLGALGIRRMVLGNHGGYKTPYFADIRGGERVTTVGAESWEILSASLKFTFFPTGLGGDAHWVYGGGFGTLLVLTYYAWRAIIRPIVNWEQPNERLKLYFFLWVLAYSLLYVLSQTWFWRQGFPMIVPMSLLVTLIARDTWREFSHDRSLVTLNYLPQLVLMASLLFHSPHLRGGLEEDFHQTRLHRNGLLNALIEKTTNLGPDQTIYLAVSVEKKHVSTFTFWLEEVRGENDLRVLPLAFSESSESFRRPNTGSFDKNETAVRLSKKLSINDSTARRIHYRDNASIPVATEPTDQHLFFINNGQATLVPIRLNRPDGAHDSVVHPETDEPQRKKGKRRNARAREARPDEAQPTPKEQSTTTVPDLGPVDVPGEP